MRSSGHHGEGVKVQSRDIHLLSDLLESRCMTLTHLSAVHFLGKAEAAKKRLQKLKAAGFTSARQKRPYEPALLSVTWLGYQLLREHGYLERFPAFNQATFEKHIRLSPLTLQHELAVMDVKAGIVSAVRLSNLIHVRQFDTWTKHHEFNIYSQVIKPDGFIQFEERDGDGAYEHSFFLEVDRSTETLSHLSAKLLAYRDFYSSGGFAKRCGGTPEQFREYPFRVLMVFRTAERRNNAAREMLAQNPPIRTMACLSTMDEVAADPLGPIWLTPTTFQEAVQGSSYENLSSPAYRRNAERERFIESRIVKQSLFKS